MARAAASDKIFVTAMQSTFKPALLLMGGRMVAFATTFFIPVVLVRIFDQAEFGTYKQIFLIYTTLYLVAQFGMAESLYYFLPMEPTRGGRYAANSVIALMLAGLVCVGALQLEAPRIAGWLANDALVPYIPYVGVYLLLTMVSAVLEIVMTARKRFLLTAGTFAVSEIFRGAAFMIPALLTGELRWVLIGAIAFASVRLLASLLYFIREFHGDVFPDRTVLKKHLAYALPFGLAEILAFFGSQYHQYAVSHYFNAATFAIYSIGCLNIPLVELVHGPVGNVMMVRMGEELREGRSGAVLEIWNDTTRKLALVFFPMLGLLLITARDLIVFLFTENYLASVPVFLIWSTTVLLPVLQTDGVLRVFAQTRFLVFMHGVKLLLTAALIYWFIARFGVWGAALVTVMVSFTAKILSLGRFKQIAEIPFHRLLPWKSLAKNAAVTSMAATAAMLIKAQLDTYPLVILFATGASFCIVYLALAFTVGLITNEERQALFGSLQRIPGRAAKVGQLLKGL
jgi:O-antigen/teichoic acid export membrane protein